VPPTCPSSARNALPSSLMSSSTAVYLAPSSFSRFLALTQNGHLHSQCRTLSIWQRCATSLVHTAVTHTNGSGSLGWLSEPLRAFSLCKASWMATGLLSDHSKVNTWSS